jgi:acyl-CoA reductase-like NAD-dependent aldehyde dehydrogenase
LVHNNIKDLFTSKLVARVANMRVGDPMDMTTHIGPLIMPPTHTFGHYDRVMGLIDRAKSDDSGHIKLMFGGESVEVQVDNAALPPPETNGPGGLYVQPTIFECMNADVEIAREEIFGPVACVLGFDTEEEAVALANDTDYGLAAGVMTNDVGRAHRIAKAFEAGTVWINNYNLSPSEVCTVLHCTIQ